MLLRHGRRLHGQMGIVIQSGNYEFIGIRHRSTQTLSISDLIKPHACIEPSYGKLHLGLYMVTVVVVRMAVETAVVPTMAETVIPTMVDTAVVPRVV
jgi:hypothetical protein